jgi:hypothetical protein
MDCVVMANVAHERTYAVLYISRLRCGKTSRSAHLYFISLRIKHRKIFR